jgi:hypothetical protein
MKHAPVAFLVVLAGCPSSGNPPVLWLATNMTETAVKLVDSEPNPY